MTSLNLAAINERVSNWARQAVTNYSATNAFLFGSLIYKNGSQFVAYSDIDLVLEMPDGLDAIGRHRWLSSLSEHKSAIEIEIMRILEAEGTEPLVSIVAVTKDELKFNVHKDGHREFFTENTFKNLIDDVESKGIPSSGQREANRFINASFAFAQKMRNSFLAVAANTKPRLVPYKGPDPLPKSIMRAAAMAGRAVGETSEAGAEHDVNEGLELLTNWLNNNRRANPSYAALRELLSVRRGGRGTQPLVEPTDQLLLAEIIFDIARGSIGDEPQAPSGDGYPSVGDAQPTPPAPEAPDVDAAEERQADRPPMPFGSSTAFFAERFASAFPGARTTTWYQDPSQIKLRLLALLKKPLKFADGTPIWWWRLGNFQIEKFEHVQANEFLMNYEELKIAKIAACPSPSYARSFVYVETEAMPETGLYEHDTRPVEELRSGYRDEEYAIYDGKTLITRGEYDDGHFERDGVLTPTRGKAELRVRFITPYNFVIAANGSPINNNAFDFELERILNQALRGDAVEVVGQLVEVVSALPLRQSRLS